MNSSSFFKLVCFNLFDVSPANAFREDSVNTYAASSSRGKHASTDSESEKQSSSQRNRRVRESMPLPGPRPVCSKASSSKLSQNEVDHETQTGIQQQVGSHKRSSCRRRLVKLFNRKSTNAKAEMQRETNQYHPNWTNAWDNETSNIAEVDEDPDSLFEIQLEGIRSNSDTTDPQLTFRENAREPEINQLQRNLGTNEQNYQNLKRELRKIKVMRHNLKGQIRKQLLEFGDYGVHSNLSFSEWLHRTGDELEQETASKREKDCKQETQRECTPSGESSSEENLEFEFIISK